MKSIEHVIRIDGSDIHYWEYNPTKTPTILVIHGFRGTHHGLESVIKELPQYRFIVPDMPGFGDSEPMNNRTHTIANYARYMQTFITATELNHPVLLGHSMGSIVVADMIADDQTLTDKAIFINPIATKPTAGMGAIKIAPGIAYHWLAGKILPEKIGNLILTNKQLFLIGSSTMTKTKDPELRKWIHWNHITYMKRFSDRKTLLEAYDSSSNTTIADYTDKISLPVLMIAGKKDSIAPIKGQRVLASKLKDATLVEINNVGHIVHYEKPKEAAAAIVDFLSKK